MDLDSFPKDDPENPRNWPPWRKWSIVAAIIPIDLSVSWGASGYSPAEMLFGKDFGVSAEVATLGLSLYILGLALGPMTLAPLSEYFGRSPIYIGSYAIFLAFLLGTALVQSLGAFLALRFCSGLFSSVTIANFGGTIADLWPHNETGIAMSLFLWAATCGSPSGYFLMSFVASKGNWRLVFWALLGICAGFWLIMTAVLKETRHTTILQRRAMRALRENPASRQERTPEVLYHRSSKDLIKIALARPFKFLFTEYIIIFSALYNGYLYGLSFLFNTAFSLVFGPMGHGFGTIGVGLCFLGICVGISIGPLTNLWQERYYQRAIKGRPGANIPEARLQTAMIAAIVFPISLFWFAWTTSVRVHFIVPLIASAFWGWSFYTLILMTYLYTEDSYKVFSASALAGIGLVRNIAGASFPLFGRQLFVNLGYHWGGSLLAFLAVLLVPIPFVLAKFGPQIRRKSPWASQHMEEPDTADGTETVE